MAIYGYARASTLEHLNVLGRYAFFMLPELVARRTASALVKCPMMISELGHTTHSRHVENPYLGFLFRCYSDPAY